MKKSGAGTAWHVTIGQKIFLLKKVPDVAVDCFQQFDRALGAVIGAVDRHRFAVYTGSHPGAFYHLRCTHCKIGEELYQSQSDRAEIPARFFYAQLDRQAPRIKRIFFY